MTLSMDLDWQSEESGSPLCFYCKKVVWRSRVNPLKFCGIGPRWQFGGDAKQARNRPPGLAEIPLNGMKCGFANYWTFRMMVYCQQQQAVWLPTNARLLIRRAG